MPLGRKTFRTCSLLSFPHLWDQIAFLGTVPDSFMCTVRQAVERSICLENIWFLRRVLKVGSTFFFFFLVITKIYYVTVTPLVIWQADFQQPQPGTWKVSKKRLRDQGKYRPPNSMHTKEQYCPQVRVRFIDYKTTRAY